MKTFFDEKKTMFFAKKKKFLRFPRVISKNLICGQKRKKFCFSFFFCCFFFRVIRAFVRQKNHFLRWKPLFGQNDFFQMTFFPLARKSIFPAKWLDKRRQEDKTRQDKARQGQGKVRQGKARQDKIGQDTTRQDKTSRGKPTQHNTAKIRQDKKRYATRKDKKCQLNKRHNTTQHNATRPKQEKISTRRQESTTQYKQHNTRQQKMSQDNPTQTQRKMSQHNPTHKTRQEKNTKTYLASRVGVQHQYQPKPTPRPTPRLGPTPRQDKHHHHHYQG